MVNDVAGEGVGIDADTNAATFLTPTTAVELPEMPKRQLADRILDEILTLRRPRPMCSNSMNSGTRMRANQQAGAGPCAEESVAVERAPRRQLIVE